ncbi:MAG: Co2+/Mg2+ efflux protein ApaG [Porticoccaceae bacterium]|jgi:ApaG protein|tara:strand:- start:2463 stop:2834 length:372 start_codon:yes stop_codon:yes gene_type:complete
MKNLITISVSTEYLDNQSKPEDGRYVFAYHITIENHANQAVQLLSRHWIIVDANQERKEVRGLGVIGEQPTLAPGGTYKYTSGVVLATPIGTMEGTYQLTYHEGESFDAAIEPFLLSIPHAVH